MKLFFYAYKSWGHDPIWYFSCLCRKFSELRALLFLSSTQTSQNLKFIQKCPCLSSLKNKFQWTQKKFRPLIRKILIWTFWDYKSSWSKKSTPIQPRGVIGAPLLCIFKRCNSWECSVHFFRGPCTNQSSNFQSGWKLQNLGSNITMLTGSSAGRDRPRSHSSSLPFNFSRIL